MRLSFPTFSNIFILFDMLLKLYLLAPKIIFLLVTQQSKYLCMNIYKFLSKQVLDFYNSNNKSTWQNDAWIAEIAQAAGGITVILLKIKNVA